MVTCTSILATQEQTMSTTSHFTSHDLDLFRESMDRTRCEIIDGDLLVSKQPHLEH